MYSWNSIQQSFLKVYIEEFIITQYRVQSIAGSKCRTFSPILAMLAGWRTVKKEDMPCFCRTSGNAKHNAHLMSTADRTVNNELTGHLNKLDT